MDLVTHSELNRRSRLGFAADIEASTMAAFNPDRFAHEWSAAWNARDLERILAHFSDTVVFSSPKTVDAIGRPTVRGTSCSTSWHTTRPSTPFSGGDDWQVCS